ncbi:LacI family transcriptional regulator [Microbacterium sp. W1N]|uniref:LacI family DNA-binding transcriptional regulator n=1 Tax=Microbacterium festucae TaxID=2977531 RepID=UPI0021C126BE|nr:LacI family DNA-binding transcriptional regulator [Microbacterium festucae]MCT9820801.1 LacI family transcriptional regulator [Microbacterium festucae]
MAEVAELAGVSISTVSKVANGSADVGEETRARVAELLQRYEYVPRRKRRTFLTVTVLVRDISLATNVEFLAGAMAEAQSQRVQLALEQHKDDEPEEGWIEQFTPQVTRAVIALSSALRAEHHEQLASRGIPLIVVYPQDTENLVAPSIGATDWAGGVSAAKHLLSLGHSRFAMLAGPHHTLVARARLSGFRDALESAGAPLAPQHVVEGTFDYESGIRQALELLRGPDRPTAIFAASDRQAMGALEAARRLGLRVPEDLSLVGFDDIAPSSMTAPPLTTVAQPLKEMGALAITMALSLIENQPLAVRDAVLTTSLVVRGSTGTPPA